jgi:hypothetical protein
MAKENKMTKEQDIQKVKELNHGCHCYIFWFEESGGEAHRIWDHLFLFEIPQYGNEGRFRSSFHISKAEELVNLVYNTFT